MQRLYHVDTGITIGVIARDALDQLVEAMELEGPADRDLHVSRATLDYLRERGVPDALVALLESALGDRSDIDIAWDDQDPSAPVPQGPYR